ncbi:uncharacterized protein (TIRG00374 family) [Litoreibacter ponti]|uniref:Uncharacterized protein (TIRG00374 family) n=1 Tax=Litoreibacter ponti TaxID=1510457 RepID=A0A2T6BEL5_9RHOB|nr:lysylphosphatidylglycerol synthase transmembrane domain-containing protein [Litoreibacter ponti]PTX54511.1 uncharacterized protein (TIRG00374 family) [Litoreibacter ponti]
MKARVLKFAVSIGCLLVLLRWADPTAVFAQLSGAEPVWIGAAFLALTAATFSMAARWQIVAKAFGLHFSYPFALREYYLAQLINTSLPGGVAGDVTRAVRARRAADMSSAALSVMAERMLGQVTIFALMFVGFAFVLFWPDGSGWARLGWIVLSSIAVGAAVILALARRDGATAAFLRTTMAQLKSPQILLHSAVTSFCLIFAFYACAQAIGTELSSKAFATVIPLVLSAMLVPLSVGGWGWREGAAAALFPLVGAPASAGIATGILYGVVVFIAALPAAFLLAASQNIEPFTPKRKPDLS